LGYSGWIKNANTISFSKFENLIKYTSKSALSNSEILQLYNNKVYIPNYDNENSIFYFVREPGIGKINNFPSEPDYLEYLKFMEGSAKSLKIRNFCYEAVLILDGTFTVPVTYNDLISISVGENKVRTLDF